MNTRTLFALAAAGAFAFGACERTDKLPIESSEPTPGASTPKPATPVIESAPTPAPDKPLELKPVPAPVSPPAPSEPEPKPEN